jgi:hypothetical protein
MKKTVIWLAWFTIALVAALAALNWPTLIAPAAFNFVVTEIQLPLGLLMLALAAVPLGLFFVAYLHQQIGALMETRRLLREVQRAHELADKAEASRVEGLRQLLTDEFRAIHTRLDSLGAAPPADAVAAGMPTGLRRILPGPWRGEVKQV